MCPGDNQVMPPAEKELFKCLRERKVSELAVEDSFDGWIPSREGISDDDDICMGDILAPESRCDNDPFGFQKRGHRGVNFIVLAGDDEPSIFHCGSDGSHRGAADP